MTINRQANPLEAEVDAGVDWCWQRIEPSTLRVDFWFLRFLSDGTPVKTVMIQTFFLATFWRDPPYSEYIRKMSTCEKRHKKRHKTGCPLFFVSDFRFLHTLPTGKGKKADIYQKRRFAFGFVFYRFCAAFVSKYFVYYQCYRHTGIRFLVLKNGIPDWIKSFQLFCPYRHTIFVIYILFDCRFGSPYRRTEDKIWHNIFPSRTRTSPWSGFHHCHFLTYHNYTLARLSDMIL
jgi:hypothetical protein